MEKLLKKPPILEGYVYSYDEAVKSRDKGEILTIRLETSRVCNLKCKYCCNKSGQKLPDEISYNKIKELVIEAKKLGVKSIIVIGGGEPTIYPQFKELISFIHENDIIPVIFTNTQTMTLDLATFLYKNNVSVIIKLDSLDEKIQDEMVGVPGAYKNIQTGLKNLFAVGYAKNRNEGKQKLGASFVVNKENYNDVLNIWRFCRENYIFPNLEMMIPNGNAKNIKEELISSEQWGTLKESLLAIDEQEFGYTWFPYTPLIGASCFQVMYNLYITVQGDVRPCSSIHCSSYNIKDYTLKEIIKLPFFERARNIEKNLTGKCKDCDKHNECIGCRGLAFACNKGLMSEIECLCAEDPSCAYKR